MIDQDKGTQEGVVFKMIDLKSVRDLLPQNCLKIVLFSLVETIKA